MGFRRGTRRSGSATATERWSRWPTLLVDIPYLEDDDYERLAADRKASATNDE